MGNKDYESCNIFDHFLKTRIPAVVNRDDCRALWTKENKIKSKCKACPARPSEGEPVSKVPSLRSPDEIERARALLHTGN